MAQSRAEVLARKRYAYLQHKKGVAVLDIAYDLGLSERMVYRYIDEFELAQLRKWKSAVDEALNSVPLDAPVSTLLKVIKAKNSA